MFRETVERPEIKQKENIERTFRAAPKEDAWETTTGGWLYPSQVPSMQVVQLAEHSSVPNTRFHELSKTEEESTRREGFTACATYQLGQGEGGISARRNSL